MRRRLKSLNRAVNTLPKLSFFSSGWLITLCIIHCIHRHLFEQRSLRYGRVKGTQQRNWRRTFEQSMDWDNYNSAVCLLCSQAGKQLALLILGLPIQLWLWSHGRGGVHTHKPITCRHQEQSGIPWEGKNFTTIGSSKFQSYLQSTSFLLFVSLSAGPRKKKGNATFLLSLIWFS